MTKKFSQLTEKTNPVSADLVAILDSEGLPETKKATIGNLLLGYESNPAYGVQWDQTQDAYTRLGSTAGYPTSQTIDDELLPIQAAMRGCILNDSGVLQYLLDDNDHTKKEGGAAADLTGGDGQVMIRIPKFWYRYWYDNGKHNWMISPIERAGYSVHSAFIKAGSEVDYRYVGKYQATLYDASATAYIDGDGTGGADTGNDILSSVSGKKPWSNETRANMRTLAENRGAGWHQLDINLAAAIQLLYLVEYADFNSQNMISEGNTKFSSFDFATCIQATGKSNSDGMLSTGQATTNGDLSDYVVYRGVEDIFGNLWQFLDGININNSTANRSQLYLASDYTVFADDTDSDYDLIQNGTLLEVDDYVTDLIATRRGFFAKQGAGGGAASTYLTDYYWTYYDTAADSGWRVVLLGASAYYGSRSGAFALNAISDSANASASIGARLCY